MKTAASIILLFSITMMNAQNIPKSTVDVSGEGIVQVVPDKATVTVQVEHNGQDAQSVQKQTDNTISKVLKYLKSSGVEEKDVKTQYLRLNKNYDYKTKTYSYVANQTLEILIRDLDDYSSLMNGLLDTGINRIQGIVFDASNRKELEQQARVKAIYNAKEKAQLYATTLGQQIGKAIHISEFQQHPSPGPMLRSYAMDEVVSDNTVAPGQMDISIRLNLSFELL